MRRSLILFALLALPVAGSGQEQGDPIVTLRNAHGMVVRLLPQGATVMAIEVPDRQGRMANVVLGYPTAAEYRVKMRKNFFGATIGRYAGRIDGAQFTLDGRTVRLTPNDGANALHGGGTQGFESADWTLVKSSHRWSDRATFRLVSPDGYQGFPGRVTVDVTYRIGPDDSLRIDYVARSTRPTVLNLTNHSYFNLGGEASGSVSDQRLQLLAARYFATDDAGIPTGALPPVAGTPLDFTCPRAIGDRIASTAAPMSPRGYNHAWLFDKPADKLASVAQLRDPASGRTLTVQTSEPTIQVYTGGYIDGQDAGPGGHVYRPTDGVALEVQRPSDAPHHAQFASTVLRPGKAYRQTTIWRFGIDTPAIATCAAPR